MKFNEKYTNYPEDTTTVVNAVEAQALEDTDEFQKRQEEVNKEISKTLDKNGKIDGAPKQPKPEDVIVPEFEKVELDESLFEGTHDNRGFYVSGNSSKPNYGFSGNTVKGLLILARDEDGASKCAKNKFQINNPTINETDISDWNKVVEYCKANNIEIVNANDDGDFYAKTHESLDEDINEENAGRVVQRIIKEKFGIDVDVATYKDTENSKSVIVQFIVSAEENQKMKYDELKEEIYKRIKDVNISCKQFSSPNLKNKGVEYKLKLFIIKENKDKSKIYAENLVENTEDTMYNINEGRGKAKKPVELSPWTKVYIELSKQNNFSSAQSGSRELDVLNGDRYWDDPVDDAKNDLAFDGNDIIVKGKTEEYLDFAKKVAEHYGIDYEMKYSNTPINGDSRKYRLVIKFRDDQLPTEEEEEATDTKYTVGYNKKNGEIEDWPEYADELHNSKYYTDGKLDPSKLVNKHAK